MKLNDPAKVLTWLHTKPSSEEMRAAFPAEWAAMEKELAEAISQRNFARLHRLLNPTDLATTGQSKRAPSKRERTRTMQAAIKQRMTALAIERYSLAFATGQMSGKVRFNLFNGLLAQWLLFKQGFERKPVSMFWFNVLWPLVWQKRYLMPLAESKGIYCFYSKPFVSRLAQLLDGRMCLEIGAGDGTLTGFLQEQGVQIAATDDYSWSHKIQYPEWVVRMDAQSALRQYAPEAVICSWPPARNDFEASVFRTDSVSLYIAIVSELRFASGNWDAYQSQSAFTMEHDPELSRLLLPPELGSEAVIFRRKSA